MDKSQETLEHTNALIDQTSPYLLQHAHNPVDWMPWGEEAFAKARDEDKLVLVSIGYSACHWCHVMERETFEDTDAAEYMNEYFVCIKVDREERPDVDHVYMTALQLMTRQGGWPLNCFTLPNGKPIYGGTYFPKEHWMEVLGSLVNLKKEDPGKMREYSETLTEGVNQVELIERSDDMTDFSSDDISSLVDSWKKSWDMKNGGPNRAPKFPLPNNYDFLLQHAYLNNDEETPEFVKTTLKEMARGGIYDQVGGGFARYSTDMLWKVPHFEKMLYDNAQLVSLYADAFKLTGSEEYKQVVFQTLEFIDREMTSSEGVFYSGIDADSEGIEGKFYVWKKEELQEVLGDQFDFVEQYYNVNNKGLWEEGNYILLRSMSDEEMAGDLNLTAEEVKAKAAEVNAKLLKARSNRIRPGLDDKTLTSWNALMISGYASAFEAFGEEKFRERAEIAAEFIWNQQFRDGVLYHNYKERKTTIEGFLEDYCFIIEAYINLYEVTFDEKWLVRANELMSIVISKFENPENGLYWFTAEEGGLLVARKQEITDNVMPASNSSIAKSLFRLGHIHGNEEYIGKSRQMLRNVIPEMKYGQSYSNWGILLLWQVNSFYEVAITGSDSENKRKKLLKMFAPNKVTIGAESSSSLDLLKGKFSSETTIFVCQNKSCQQPVSQIDLAMDQMKP